MSLPERFENTPPVPAPWHEFANVFPMLQGEALDGLRRDIAENGVREPVVFLGGSILDGRNRYICARDLGIDYPRREFGSQESDGTDPLAFVISHNLTRRHLSESQRASAASRLANMKRGENQHTSIGGTSQAEAAKMLNVGVKSVERAKKVHDKGAPELVEALDKGEVSVSAAADVAELPKEEQAEIVARGEKEILAAAKAIRVQKAAERKAANANVAAQSVPTPAGLYDAIVIDPPWPMEKIERDVRPNQTGFDYPTMSEGDLADMPIPAGDNCHMWLWTTHKFLPVALRLLEVWDFRYVCTFVWHKPGGFQPIGLPQYNCEFALYARKGSPKFIDTKAFPVCFNAPRGAHSEKPEEFYSVIRRVTDGRRIDMFNRRPIDGFDTWGNEAQ